MLKEFSLATLGETKVAPQFAEGMAMILESLEKDKDIKGKRSISIDVSFTPDDRGIVMVDMAVKASTPHRTVKTIAMLEDKNLKIDVVSNDAQQPDIFDDERIAYIKQGGK